MCSRRLVACSKDLGDLMNSWQFEDVSLLQPPSARHTITERVMRKSCSCKNIASSHEGNHGKKHTDASNKQSINKIRSNKSPMQYENPWML